jgi:hypothetical protein
MSGGDELTRKRELLLCELFERGAIAYTCAVGAHDLQKVVGVNDDAFLSLYLCLFRAK